ncbi:hypothetical protein Q9966_014989 [Columba livia]|nr:hypothetical protein Q9966_014989 [Columba livia]
MGSADVVPACRAPRTAAANERGGRGGTRQGERCPQSRRSPGRTRAGEARCRLLWRSSAPQPCSAAAPGRWPDPCQCLFSAGLRLRPYSPPVCPTHSCPAAASKPARSPGTSTRPPSSSVPARPRWGWPVREPVSGQCSAA